MSQEQEKANFIESLSKLNSDELATRCVDLYESIQKKKAQIKSLQISLEAQTKISNSLQAEKNAMKKQQEQKIQDDSEKAEKELREQEARNKTERSA